MNEEKAQSAIEQMDTTKVGIRPYLDEAGAATKTSPFSGAAMKLAVFRFIADSARIAGAERQALWKQFNATPGWFGNNASAGRQAYGEKSALERLVEEIEA